MARKVLSGYQWRAERVRPSAVLAASGVEERKGDTDLKAVPASGSLDPRVTWMMAMYSPFLLAPIAIVVMFFLRLVGVDVWTPW